MTRNRRPVRTDAVFFLTIATQDRRPLLKDERFLELVCEDLGFYGQKFEVSLYGYFLMPDHIHLAISLSGGQDLSMFVKLFKQHTTREWLNQTGGKGPIWQKGFYDHVIENERDFLMHLEYMHKNPIKHGLADSAEKYRWSSFHEYEQGGRGSPLKVAWPVL